MRTIKFRGKRVDNGEWVFGSYIRTELVKVSGGPFTLHQIHSNKGHQEMVDPETVGQFTGRTDKNTVEIFEGDLVKCVNRHIGVVEWEKYDACFNVSGYHNTSDDYPTMAFIEGAPFEIVGNIHDGEQSEHNPELLNQ